MSHYLNGSSSGSFTHFSSKGQSLRRTIYRTFSLVKTNLYNRGPFDHFLLERNEHQRYNNFEDFNPSSSQLSIRNPRRRSNIEIEMYRKDLRMNDVTKFSKLGRFILYFFIKG